MDTEKVRMSYKPVSIKLLLVGESPPASGQFFYVRSLMTIYTSRAFETVFSKSFVNTSAFLEFFQDKGCYLEDLTTTPVNKMSTVEREKTLEQGVILLSKKLIDYNPEAIVIVLKKIERYVKNAIRITGLSCPVYTLPFPGNGHQNRFIQGLSIILEKHYLEKT